MRKMVLVFCLTIFGFLCGCIDLYIKETSINQIDEQKDSRELLNEAENHYSEGNYKFQSGLYVESEKYLLSALNIWQTLLGGKHPRVVDALLILSSIYNKFGQNIKSEILQRRVLTIYKSLSLMDRCDYSSNDYDKYDYRVYLPHRGLDEEFSEMFFDACKKVYGNNHEKTLASAAFLSNIFIRSRAYSKLRSVLNSIRIELANTPRKGNTWSYIHSYFLYNFANSYLYQKKYEEAALVHKEVIDRFSHIYACNYNVAAAWLGLGSAKYELGLLDEAEKALNETLNLASDLGNGDDYDTIESSASDRLRAWQISARLLLADIQTKRGKHEKADTYLTVVHRLISDSFQQNQLLSQHMQVSYLLKKYDKYVYYLEKWIALLDFELRENIISANENISYISDKLNSIQEIIAQALLTSQDREDIKTPSLKFLVAFKNRSFSEKRQIEEVVRTQMPDLAHLYLPKLKEQRSRISTALLHGSDAQARREIAAAEAEIRNIEQRMAQHSAALRVKLAQPGVEALFTQFKAAISADTAYVDFVKYQEFDFTQKKPSDARAFRYLALLYEPSGKISTIDLGAAPALEEAVERFHAAVSSPQGDFRTPAQALHAHIFTPLARALSYRRLILSVDGALHKVPFHGLFDGREFLGDQHEIAYVSAGRDLLRRDLGRTPSTQVAVFARPDYQAAQPAAAGTSRGTSEKSRGFDLQSLSDLPATQIEAQDIKELFPSARLLLGRDATETALLRLESPGVLHIATHGLYAAEMEEEAGAGSRAARGFHEAKTPAPRNPLVSSALALAGAAVPVGATAGEADRPDGVVTALELSSANLWGTQLVVLSACNTGRGQVRLGQGVYGLSRAVLAAGAETLVTSLWRVSDETTRDLMRAYYRHLLDGEGRAEAMQSAASEVRREHPHPYYWASFVVTGNGAPLQGIRK